VAGNLNKTVQLVGTTPAYLDVQQWELVQGRGFTETESRTSANVALLGATVVRELFPDLPPGASPVGQVLRVQRQVVEVVGVLQAKGQGFGGQDQDDVMVLPVTTVQRRLAGTPFPGAVSMGMVRVAQGADKAAVDQQITLLLRQRHRLADGVDNDFSVRDLAALSASLAVVSQVLSVLLGSIAFISLLVGGIGVMNIMLVSVTERTREIGVRMAVGARQADIRQQFLIEAVLVCLLGGVLGIGLSLLVGWGFDKSGSSFTLVYSTLSMVAAFVCSTLIGVIFGFLPANNAAKLNPVDALSRE
jgi:ABC-type antimicrobial peptide transport system permease subunit